MAEELKGTIIYGPIYPPNTDQKYATHDADYGKGGYRSVNSIEERDNITYQRRSVGMEVRVLNGEDAGVYTLKSFTGSTRLGVTSQEWEKVDSGSFSQEVTITGGPLSDEALEVFPSGKIPAGTSIESVLTALLCKEEYPKPSIQNASLIATIGKPTITCKNHSSSKNHVAIVETDVSLSIVSPSITECKNTSNKIGNLGFGYFGAKLDGESWVIDKTVESQDTSIEKSWKSISEVQSEEDKYSIIDAKIIQGFPETDSSNETSTPSHNSAGLYVFTNRKIQLGTNKVSAKAQGKRYQGYVDGIDPVFYKSSLNNYSEEKITEKLDSIGSEDNLHQTLPAISEEATLTITGVFPVYHNMTDSGYDMAEWPVEFNLTAGNCPTGDEFTIKKETITERFSFIYPSTHIPKVEVHDGTKWATWAGGAIEGDVDKELAGVTYKKYTLSGSSSGGGKLRITFDKNLNTK